MLKTKTVLIILAVILLLGYTGGFWGGKWYFEQGNTYFHFVGGFFIAFLIISYYATEFKRLRQPLRFFVILGLTISVGVFWEFHEFVLQQLFGGGIEFQGDSLDTMKDLLMDTLGGALGAIFFLRS